jgi:hypothetical protein
LGGEKKEICTGFWWEILKVSNSLEEISLGRWIMLKERYGMVGQELSASGLRMG